MQCESSVIGERRWLSETATENVKEYTMSQTTKMTRQGVRDLNYIKGKSVGIRLTMQPQDAAICKHPIEAIEEDRMSGCTHCRRCKQMWDFDGKPIN